MSDRGEALADHVGLLVARVKELESQLAAEKKAREEQTARLERVRGILFAYEQSPEGNEITAHPWWAVVRRGSFGRHVVLDGPFFSRERATKLLEARRYEYGDKASVFCFSGHRSQHYRELRNVFDAALSHLEDCGAGAVEPTAPSVEGRA